MEKSSPKVSGLKESAPVGSSASHLFVAGISPSIKAVERAISELADGDVPVLLMAEAGAGKRATAERIHQLSAHCQESFEAVACAGLTPEALNTDSTSPASTFFRGGTVYLEEVGDLSAQCQQNLLEMLTRAGNNGQPAENIARLICGTARDLEAEVRCGRFREDLYYRISGVSLRLPPLRQRQEDIPQLVSFFLAKYATEFRRPVPVLSAETQRLFAEYAWPGNLRELEDVTKAIVALGDEALAMGGLRSLLVKFKNGNGERVSLKEAAKAASREAEKELILRVLSRTRWNRRRAAQELQISYKALLYKLKQIGYGEYGAS
jgi:two-component system response regulator AtoC